MRRRNRRLQKGQSGNDYWQSYSDMMAALLLMFVLIMALTMLQSLKTYEEKNADLEQQRITIEEQRAEIEAQREILDKQEANLNEVTNELDELTRMVGVKSEIISALREEFRQSGLGVDVDEQTGAITFDTGVFFAVNSSDIRSEGAAFLNSFLPQYLSVLLSEEYQDSVAEVIIEGHTDLDGTYMYNLDLSQRRAYAVARFCLEESDTLTEEHQQLLRNILTANGRSFSNPIYDENGEVDSEASRRVVFKFRLKDEEMVDAIEDLLGETND